MIIITSRDGAKPEITEEIGKTIDKANVTEEQDAAIAETKKESSPEEAASEVKDIVVEAVRDKYDVALEFLDGVKNGNITEAEVIAAKDGVTKTKAGDYIIEAEELDDGYRFKVYGKDSDPADYSWTGTMTKEQFGTQPALLEDNTKLFNGDKEKTMLTIGIETMYDSTIEMLEAMNPEDFMNEDVDINDIYSRRISAVFRKAKSTEEVMELIEDADKREAAINEEKLLCK